MAYFSRTGNTKPLAEYAAEYLGATLFEITAKIPYTDEDIAYYTDCRADREQKDESARPEIATAVENMDEYDTVIIAYAQFMLGSHDDPSSANYRMYSFEY